ncbi:MAG: hypothetical protein IPI77_17880 [Saprospiraceae bacterium]|nr:hypothetical protein [Saprospiraceae bacterium]
MYQLAFYPEAYPSVNEVERFYQIQHTTEPICGLQTRISTYNTRAVPITSRQSSTLRPNYPLGDSGEITYRKGGYSILVSRFYPDLLENKTEELCWYQMGP